MDELADLITSLEAAAATLARSVGDAGVDPAAMPTYQLDELVQRLQRVVDVVELGAAKVLAEWDRRGAWRTGGHHSAAHCLANTARLSNTTARRRVQRARHLEAMPLTADAVLAGRLSLDHVDLFGRAAAIGRGELFAEHEAVLVEQCSALRWKPATRAIEYWIQHADALAAEQAGRLRTENVHCWASPTVDGVVMVDALLDPIGGEIFCNELERLERQLWLSDQATGRDRKASQRRAEALVEMARRSAATTIESRMPRPLFTVLVGDETARNLCQLASGTVLHPSELAPWIDDALMESVLFDGPSTVLAVSPRRTFTGVLRRAIVARDRFCTHPSGCDVPADRCDVDHLLPWSEGGVTSQANGAMECRPHNRNAAKHGSAREPKQDRVITREDVQAARLRWRERHGLAPPGGPG